MAADNDFDFGPPPQRREAKRFVPPPWEQDAFADLERRRLAEEAEERPEQESSREPTNALPSESRGAREDRGSEVVAAAEGSNGPARRQGELDEGRVLEMLAGLSDQEPQMSTVVYRVSMGAALLQLGVGAVLVVWGMAALVAARNTGPVGFAGAMVLLLFGAGFIGAAVWLTVRTLRQRGVL